MNDHDKSLQLRAALVNANELITKLMPGLKHIALLDYAFLNDTCIQIKKALTDSQEKNNE